MCGMPGVIIADGGPVDRTILAETTGLLGHGPDGTAAFAYCNLGLAQAGLSSTDIADGRQPPANVSQSVWITLNGCIETSGYPDACEGESN